MIGRRRCEAIATLLAIAVLLAAGQHSLRLCRSSDHARRAEPASAQAACPEHAAQPDPSSRPENGHVPSCCGPSVALFSIPSLKGVAAGDPEAPPAVVGFDGKPAVATIALDSSAMRLAVESVERTRFPHLRPHLALHTILV